MKTSVLIIAHNEERYIAQCLQSLLNQNKKADEIVLIIHNSTDRTKNIAEKYPITIISFQGPAGIPYARIEGLKHVSGDIICCIDGDSFTIDNWVEEMTITLWKGNIFAGSWVKSKGSVFGAISNVFTKYLGVLGVMGVESWIWGTSFAFWGNDKESTSNILQKSIELSKELGLTRSSDDLWLALFMSREGKLEVTNRTYVVNHPKETSSWRIIKRYIENIKNSIKIFKCFRVKTRFR
jgi:glycosyltransferase involved in cell wall biosynthesis